MNAPELRSPAKTLLESLEPASAPTTSRPPQMRWRAPVGIVAAFAAGIAITWLVLKPANGLPTMSVPAAAAAAQTVPGARAVPAQDPVKPAPPRDVVTLSEASRNGRIQTEPARLTEVPQTGALPGKLVVDENKTARLAAPVTGRIVKLFKEPGDRVAAGEMLASIDSPELSTVQAEARKAQVEAELKSSAAQRMSELHAAGAVALKEWQAAKAEASQAQVELDRTKSRLRQLNSVGPDATTYSLISPIAGTVTERSVTLGQQVRADEALNLFVISDLRRLTLVIDVPEAQAGRFALAQKLRVLVEGAGTGEFEGSISRIGPSVDPATRRVQVRAIIDNGSAQLRPEMFARAFGTDAQQRKALELPIAALAARGSQTAVFVERQNGTYERIPVAILIQHPERAWVSPIAGKTFGPGDAVVSQGALLLDSEIVAR